MKNKVIRNDSYHLNMVSTKKFKTTRIQISFAGPFREDTVTSRSLLPYLLSAVSEKFPTRESMTVYLEDMYAANLNVGVSKIGLTHFLSFDLSFIDDDYTFENEPLFESSLHFLHEIIFYPKFDQQIFIEESRLLKEFYDASYANKMKYTIKKHHETMFKDEKYRVNALGNIDSLSKLTISDLQKTYLKMINEDLVIITIVGDIDFDKTQKLVKDIFEFNGNAYLPILLDTQTKFVEEVTTVCETIDVNQAKLVIGYRNVPFYLADDYFETLLFNNIFGASSESMLFQEIREEKGLVYFINSSYDPYKGVMFVMSGINQDDFDDVNKTVDEVLEKIIKGDFAEELLSVAKTIIINRLIESLDNGHAILTRFHRNSLFGLEFDIEDMIGQIKHVSKNDISEVAAKLVKDTVYLLRGEANE